MSTVIPQNDKIRKAVKWISDHLQDSPATKVMRLIHQAAVRFDLNPQETDFLMRFYKDN